MKLRLGIHVLHKIQRTRVLTSMMGAQQLLHRVSLTYHSHFVIAKICLAKICCCSNFCAKTVQNPSPRKLSVRTCNLTTEEMSWCMNVKIRSFWYRITVNMLYSQQSYHSLGSLGVIGKCLLVCCRQSYRRYKGQQAALIINSLLITETVIVFV